jgi:DNA topoisomerase-6 subunit B
MPEETTIENELEDVDTSSFFHSNMSMVGFANPARALVMAVKEAVDNSLDAAEDQGVLPEVVLHLWDDETRDDVVWLEIMDNASGIPEDEIESVFGEVLYSSRFGRLKQSRGQQGIGISAAVLWSQKHLGDPTFVRTIQPDDDEAFECEVVLEKKGSETRIKEQNRVDWDHPHGTLVRMPLRASWRSQSHLEEYLEGTALANPAARIEYHKNDEHVKTWERSTDSSPDQPDEMKVHPEAADIGTIENLIEQTDATKMKTFLQREFSEISGRKARRLCQKADIDPDNAFILSKDEKERLAQEMQEIRVKSPGDDALAPLGEDLIEKTLKSRNPEFIGTSSRNVMVIGGHPTIIETGIAYGGDIESQGPVDYYRVANKVPLVYDSSSCAIRKGVHEVDWSRYELDQSASGEPLGPAVVFVHIASTEVAFGNEAKTFVADHDDIVEEIKLSLQQCGRDFSRFVERQNRIQKQKSKVEKMTPIYSRMRDRLENVTESNGWNHWDTIAKTCSTVVVTDDTVRNPTDSNRTVEIDGEEITLEPGDEVEWQDDVDYHFHPVRVES